MGFGGLSVGARRGSLLVNVGTLGACECMNSDPHGQEHKEGRTARRDYGPRGSAQPTMHQVDKGGREGGRGECRDSGAEKT